MALDIAGPQSSGFDSEESVCALILALERGDERAAALLWKNYHPRLLRYFRRWYGARARPMRDEDDLTLDVLLQVSQTAWAGGLRAISTRSRLSRTVYMIARHTLFDQRSSDRCQKRGGGVVRSAADTELAAVEDNMRPIGAASEDEEEFNNFLRCELERHPLFWPIVFCIESGLSVTATALALHKSDNLVCRNLREMLSLWREYEALSDPAKRARAALAKSQRESHALVFLAQRRTKTKGEAPPTILSPSQQSPRSVKRL